MSKVLYLKKFKNLFTLNLSGNPVSTVDDYKLLIAAYFPNLTCLDYRILNEKTVSMNSGMFWHKPKLGSTVVIYSGKQKYVNPLKLPGSDPKCESKKKTINQINAKKVIPVSLHPSFCHCMYSGTF